MNRFRIPVAHRGHGFALHTVIIPVKAGNNPKSRLHEDPILRRALALAFALDTVEAASCARMVGRVVVVTSDKVAAQEFRQLGCHIVRDRVSAATRDGLNAAIEQGRRWAARHHPHEPVAVLPADLPSLTSCTLDEVLVAAQQHELAFCADAHGTGTTVLTAAEPRALTSAYGIRSADAHRAFGAVRLDAVDRRARQDIDTMTDLAEAQRLGLGSRTLATLRKFSVEVYVPTAQSIHATKVT